MVVLPSGIIDGAETSLPGPVATAVAAAAVAAVAAGAVAAAATVVTAVADGAELGSAKP